MATFLDNIGSILDNILDNIRSIPDNYSCLILFFILCISICCMGTLVGGLVGLVEKTKLFTDFFFIKSFAKKTLAIFI